MNKYELPLWFRPGNRYKVTVYGRRHHRRGRAEVVCKKSIEFRTGEGLTDLRVCHFYIFCLLRVKINYSRNSEYQQLKKMKIGHFVEVFVAFFGSFDTNVVAFIVAHYRPMLVYKSRPVEKGQGRTFLHAPQRLGAPLSLKNILLYVQQQN